MDKPNEQTIIQFISGQCSQEVLNEVYAWMREDEAHAQEVFSMEQQYRAMKATAIAPKYIETSWKSVVEKISFVPMKARARTVGLNRLMKYAAVLVAAVLVGGALWWQYAMQ